MDINFHTDGFMIIRNAFHLVHVKAFEEAVFDLYLMQAKKIITNFDNILTPISISTIYESLENENKEALYQVQKMFPSCSRMRRLLDSALGLPRVGDIRSALIDGPGVFVNRPKTDRLLYKWHSEEHYYPKRRNLLNIWFPVFGDKTKENGTMSFKVGSHKRVYPFTEYQGYNRGSVGKPNHFIQYEIPENFLNDFEEYHCELKRGDLVFFHSNLVHRSNPNLSNEYSFAGVARLWNPENDLTLSGTLAATPYGNDIGWPGIRVDP